MNQESQLITYLLLHRFVFYIPLLLLLLRSKIISEILVKLLLWRETRVCCFVVTFGFQQTFKAFSSGQEVAPAAHWDQLITEPLALLNWVAVFPIRALLLDIQTFSQFAWQQYKEISNEIAKCLVLFLHPRICDGFDLGTIKCKIFFFPH